MSEDNQPTKDTPAIPSTPEAMLETLKSDMAVLTSRAEDLRRMVEETRTNRDRVAGAIQAMELLVKGQDEAVGKADEDVPGPPEPDVQDPQYYDDEPGEQEVQRGGVQ